MPCNSSLAAHKPTSKLAVAVHLAYGFATCHAVQAMPAF